MTDPDIRAADDLANAERQRDEWKRRALEAEAKLRVLGERWGMSDLMAVILAGYVLDTIDGKDPE